MKTRITITELRAVAQRLNLDHGFPTVDWMDGQSQPGHFYISQAYGGHALYQMMDESGACRDVLNTGHKPARELYELMHAFRTGYMFYVREPGSYGLNAQQKCNTLQAR